MAKMFKKTFSMLLVLCMLVGMLPVQALAEETEVIPSTETSVIEVDIDTTSGETPVVVLTIEPDAESNLTTEENVVENLEEFYPEIEVEPTPENTEIDVTVTEDTQTTTDEEGNEVKTETVVTETEGIIDGAEISGEETYTETTITTPEGNEIESNYVQEGSETIVYEDPNYSASDLPEVEVDLIPGEEPTIGTASGIVGEPVISGDADMTDGDYDYTETTVEVDRTVTADTSEIEMTETAGDLEMTPVVPEDYEGKVNASIDAGRPFGPESAGVAYIEVPVTDDEGNTMTDAEGNPLMVKIPDPETWNDSWDYQYLDKGERSTSGSVFTAKLEFVRDEEGNFVYDENGFVKWTWAETWGNPNPQPGTTLNKQVGTTMHALWDKDGDIVFTYCMDKGTNVDSKYGYIMENLDEADYIPNGGSKEKLRSIVENGYWGTEEGTGSLAKIKSDMTDAINNGLKMEFSFKREDGKVFEYTTETEEGKALILDMISKMNEGDALTSTQGAIWSYSNGYADGLTGNETLYEHWLNGNIFYGFQTQSSWYGAPKWEKNDPYYEERDVTGGAAGRMWIMYHYLMSLEGKDQNETTILNKESFLAEDGLQLIVGDKVADAEANMDENTDNDVYNVALSFTMVVEPSTENGDDLVVALYDAEGNLIRKARLAGNSENDGDDFSAIEKNGTTYTFRDIPVAENSDMTFDLRLDGLQNLKHGVYIYKAVDANGNSDFDKSQTLIGLSQGKQGVHINTKFTVNFDVAENHTITAERHWRHESDPRAEIEQQDPPTRYRYTPSTVIEEEPVPLADVPQTGDNSVLWFAVILMSVLGLCYIHMTEKKSCKA